MLNFSPLVSRMTQINPKVHTLLDSIFTLLDLTTIIPCRLQYPTNTLIDLTAILTQMNPTLM